MVEESRLSSPKTESRAQLTVFYRTIKNIDFVFENSMTWVILTAFILQYLHIEVHLDIYTRDLWVAVISRDSVKEKILPIYEVPNTLLSLFIPKHSIHFSETANERDDAEIII